MTERTVFGAPAFVREYPFGTGLLIAYISSSLVSVVRGTQPEFYAGILCIGVWFGYRLRRFEDESLEDPRETAEEGEEDAWN